LNRIGIESDLRKDSNLDLASLDRKMASLLNRTERHCQYEEEISHGARTSDFLQDKGIENSILLQENMHREEISVPRIPSEIVRGE
jgi:hypothetical protein